MNIPAPLVSVIVRSMGRPELALALAAIARQDHPAIDAIVVDATGGRHPPLPDIAWREGGHTLRLVCAGKPLKRPAAAAFGLACARGEWVTFLDDDDTCEPGHVAQLLAASARRPDALVVYGCGRLFDAEGRLQRVFGRPFNPALMHYGPLFYWQASLIRTRVRDLGCTFDEAFDVCEDRDFLAQIAQHGEFAFAPDVATFNYRPDLGTSGTGDGANRNFARVARFESLLRAKWAGTGTYHNERVARHCRHGVRAYHAGNLADAANEFERALEEYPEDPNALHGLARVELARGDLAQAEQHVRRALDVNPVATEYRATLAEILTRRRGVAADAPFARLAPCFCGSGLRYKACCGRIAAPLPAATEPAGEPDAVRLAAERHLARGEAERARSLLRAAATAERPARDVLIAAARVELALGDPGEAFALVTRATVQGIDAELGLLLDVCAGRLAAGEQHASLWAMVRTLIAHSRRRARSASGGPLHVLLRTASDEAPVTRLCRALGDDAATRILSPGDSIEPAQGGTLMLWEPHEPEPALRRALDPDRIVVRLACDDPETLLRCLVALEETWPGAALECTVPHADAGQLAPPGTLVDPPWIDPALLALAPPAPTGGAPLCVGHAGSGFADHPDEGALLRALRLDGHRVQLPCTAFLERAFAADEGPEWLALEDARTALSRLDVVVLRSAPNTRGAIDTAVLEAMAAARPVVAFSDSLGGREWIDDGRNGFLVASETQAQACLRTLAADPRLRAAIGAKAREAATAIVAAQRARVRARYRATSLIE